MSEHTPLTEAERAELQALLGDVPLGTNTAVRKWAERILAARTSTATTDTGLRERVEALARSPQADHFRDEACRHVVQQPFADNRYVRLLDDLRAVLDATAAHTTDTGARDE